MADNVPTPPAFAPPPVPEVDVVIATPDAMEPEYAVVTAFTDQTPANWCIRRRDSGDIVADNNMTKQSFVGTVEAFGAAMRAVNKPAAK